jgi:hypothetical protein
MAKRRGASKSAYFREQFEKHPDWAAATNNKELMEQWRMDHPGKQMTKSYKQAMANVKSSLRHKKRGGKKRGARLHQMLMASGQRTGVSSMVGLEIRIDDCLSLARQMDADGLQNVISNLRKARNEVVLKSSQA